MVPKESYQTYASGFFSFYFIIIRQWFAIMLIQTVANLADCILPTKNQLIYYASLG